MIFILWLYLLVLSADNICKQFGPRSSLTKHQAWSGWILFDTPMVSLKEFFEKGQQTTKSMKNFQGGQGINNNMYIPERTRALNIGTHCIFFNSLTSETLLPLEKTS